MEGAKQLPAALDAESGSWKLSLNWTDWEESQLSCVEDSVGDSGLEAHDGGRVLQEKPAGEEGREARTWPTGHDAGGRRA